MLKNYKTVADKAVSEIEIKKSKFICNIAPVSDEENALQFIRTVRNQHHKASHNAFAYDICLEAAVSRYSDDGEPAGTAGLPLLDVIKKNSLKNTVIVATRYFGGILLGAPGLARAYGKCAASGVAAASVIEKFLCIKLHISMGYSFYGNVQSFAAQGGCRISDVRFGVDVNMELIVPEGRSEWFKARVTDMTGGASIISQEDCGFCEI